MQNTGKRIKRSQRVHVQVEYKIIWKGGISQDEIPAYMGGREGFREHAGETAPSGLANHGGHHAFNNLQAII
jgi:hypothetical protein